MLGTSQLRQLPTVRLGLQVRLLVSATNVDECPEQNTQSSPHSECHLLFRIMSVLVATCYQAEDLKLETFIEISN